MIEDYETASRTLLQEKHAAITATSSVWNFSHRRRAALESLTTEAKNRASNLLFCEADKGLGLVAINRCDYVYLANLQLGSTHEIIDQTAKQTITSALYSLKQLLEPFLAGLPPWLSKWVTVIYKDGCHPKTKRRFKLLPFFRLMLKLHKALKMYPNGLLLPKVRALTGNHVHLTQPLADIVEYFTLFHVRNTPSYIKDADSVIRCFQRTQIPSDEIVWTADVAALYDSIPHAECIALNLRHLQQHNEPHALFLTALTRFILDHNYCCFGDETFRQIVGLATGVSCAGSIAHLFLEELWLNLLSDERNLYSGRYIDDLIGRFRGSSTNLRSYLNEYSNCHDNITITFDLDLYHIVFLDIVFFRGPQWHATGFLDTDCYIKPSNMHLYFTFKSEHPASCKRGLVHSEMRRFIKRCSSETGFLQHAIDLWHHLRLRGYPAQVLATYFDSAPAYNDRTSFLIPATADDSETLHVFVTPYSFVTSRTNLGPILHSAAGRLPPQLQHRRRLIAYTAAPKLRNLITFRYELPQPPDDDDDDEDPALPL